MNQDTLLLRQIHPSFVQASNVSAQVFSVTSQAFKPTPKDEYMLSVYNGDKFQPDVAYEHYTTMGIGNLLAYWQLLQWNAKEKIFRMQKITSRLTAMQL